MAEIRQWLEKLGLEEYTQTFEAEKINFDSLPYLTEDDLKEMGLPICPCRVILAKISTGLSNQHMDSLDFSSRPAAFLNPQPNRMLTIQRI